MVRVSQQTTVSDDPSSIDTAIQQPDGQQEQSMLTKDQSKRHDYEMAYFKQHRGRGV